MCTQMTKKHFQKDPDLLSKGTAFSLSAAVAHIKWKTKKYLQIWWCDLVKIRMRCADSVLSRALFSYQPCSLSRLCRTICFCLSPSHTRTLHTDTCTHTDTHICQQLLWFSIWSTSAFTARDNTVCLFALRHTSPPSSQSYEGKISLYFIFKLFHLVPDLLKSDFR